MGQGDEFDAARRAALSPLLSVEEFRPLASSVRVEVGADSRRGKLSRTNDDHYLVLRLGRQQQTLATSLSASELPSDFKESGYGMLVADGIGESGSGSVASRMALSTMAHLILHHGRWNLRIDPTTASEITERVEWYFSRTDAEISSKARANPALTDMAAAITMAYSAGDDLFIAHVGHSRAYLFRNGELIRLTRDQAIDADAADAEFDQRTQNLGHILSDAMGAGGGPPAVQLARFRLVDGDCVLLCTNGLTDVLDDGEIAEALTTRRRPEEQCKILTGLANQAGGEDNVTVILAQYRVPA